MQDSKECFKCGDIKPLSEFYKHPGMFDGRLNKCKECAKQDVRKNREDNIDYYLEFDRQRANHPKRVSARLAYQKTEAGKAAARKSSVRWKQSNKVKRACHVIFGNYMRNKERPKRCFACGKAGKVHGHHDDYSKPLDVRWLCALCHSRWHKENGEALNGN